MPSILELLTTLEYGPAIDAGTAAQAWLAAHAGGCGHCIAGGLLPADAKPRIPVYDPADGTLLAQVVLGGSDDVDRAVQAARRALPAWSGLSGRARARHLQALARLVLQHQALLAALASRNDGKPVRESRDIEVAGAVRLLEIHVGSAELLAGALPGQVAAGVCAVITAAEFSLLGLVARLAPALAAGNTVVIKPSEVTPLTAAALVELCGEAGLPPGVVNLIHGDAGTGATLAAHPEIVLVCFGGSASSSTRIRVAVAGSGTRLLAQIGGASLLVVFEDADLDAAVEGVVEAACSHWGQCGTTVTRLLLQEGIAEIFLGKLKVRMERLRLGNPLDQSTDLGALLTPARLIALQTALALAVRDGATPWQPAGAGPATGCFHAPVVLTGMIATRTVPEGGLRGPVVVADSFRTTDEAVALATEGGEVRRLAIWSEDFARALDAARRVDTRTVWINSAVQSDPQAVISGMGEDGRDVLGAFLEPAWMRRPAGLPASSGSSEAGALPPSLIESPSPGLRRAIEAAAKAGVWTAAGGAYRGRILRRLADRLEAGAAEFEAGLRAGLGEIADGAGQELAAAIARIHYYAAWGDRYEGLSAPAGRPLGVTLVEPLGVIGVVGPEAPLLLGLLSLVLPAVITGNRVIAVVPPGQARLAREFQHLCAGAELPEGVLTLVPGERHALAGTLAALESVSALWYDGPRTGDPGIEQRAARQGKPVWVHHGQPRDWWSGNEAQGPEFLRRATRIKTVWMPG